MTTQNMCKENKRSRDQYNRSWRKGNLEIADHLTDGFTRKQKRFLLILENQEHFESNSVDFKFEVAKSLIGQTCGDHHQGQDHYKRHRIRKIRT